MAVAHAVARTVEDPGRMEIRPAAEPSGRLRTASVVAGYVVLGVLAYWPLVASGGSHLFGTNGDSILATWFLAWVPHAAAHGLNPLFSNAMYVPTGINLAQNTEAPLLGALTVPLSGVLGPIWQANLLMILAMPASATAAFFVLRRWDVWWPAAAFGGLLYGFSPYMVGQGLGHLVLVFAPWPPLIALVLSRMVEGQGTARRNGCLLGLLVVAQFLTEPEVMAMVAVVALVALVAVIAAHPAGSREVARRLAAPLVLAAAIAVILLAYPVWMILAGPQHYTVPAQGALNPYVNDALELRRPGSAAASLLGVHVTRPSPAGRQRVRDKRVPRSTPSGSRGCPRLEVVAPRAHTPGTPVPRHVGRPLTRRPLEDRRSHDCASAAISPSHPHPAPRQHSGGPLLVAHRRFPCCAPGVRSRRSATGARLRDGERPRSDVAS